MPPGEHGSELLGRDADLAAHRSLEAAKQAAKHLSPQQTALMYDRIAAYARKASAEALIAANNQRESRPAVREGEEQRAP